MKTALYTLCYLDGEDASGSSRLVRNVKYVEYYSRLKDLLGFDDIVMCDNASSEEIVNSFRETVPDVKLHRFDKHLPRHGVFDYPYCWRGLHYVRELIDQGYEKIISIDSDGFVLSHRLAEFVRNCNSGWVALWCPKYQFAEAAFQILNKDKFDFFKGYTATPWQRMNGQVMEKALPFSRVEKRFVADRFGETRIPQSAEMDYYGQCPVDIRLEFRS